MSTPAACRGRTDCLACYFLRLCRFALSRLRYLCLLIFFRRFFTNEPIKTSNLPYLKGLRALAWGSAAALRMAQDPQKRKLLQRLLRSFTLHK